MTPRQLTGFAICCALLLALAMFTWLAPVLNYRAPQWVFWVFGSLIAFGWGMFSQSKFAKTRKPPRRS
jgi:hypothetical protein